MRDDGSQLGFLVAALGAAVLAVSVFLPWYGVSVTQSGAAAAQQQLSAVAQYYGNATLQAEANEFGAAFSSIAGQQLASVSAHDVLKRISVVVLVLAGVSLLASLLRLAGFSGLEAGGGQIALVGGLAALFVLYRMINPPGAQTGLVSLSLGWGIWLALLSAAAIVVGGLLATTDQSPSQPAGSSI
jgi:hypothetical protein